MDDETTLEQVSAVAAHISASAPPYMDFSVYGPHANRITRKLRFQGLRLTASGELKRVELQGPEGIDQWLLCYKVLKCTVIMLGEVEIAALDRYQNHIIILRRCQVSQKLHGEVQAASQAQRVADRRRREVNRDMPMTIPGVDDIRFCDYEVTPPCLLVVPRGLSPSAMVD
eukprot:549553-Amphidinium_carterae.1